MDFSNFLIDCLFKFKRVESFKEGFKFVFGLFWDVFRFENSLVRGLGIVVKFDGFRSDSFFG